ncbi:hypothetical protein [[Phormidium ambiguum] IAM M-71]|uniref:hypothetical protein n=1 Tax=[Phormidium ambiguum] IAM M-71 TaxID=454136 RepID=UPI0015C1B7DA|nr:hypothetical protein [Phormidium ambiguum]
MTKRRIIAFVGWILASLILVVGIRMLTQKLIIAETNSTILVSTAASLKDSLEEICGILDVRLSEKKKSNN